MHVLHPAGYVFGPGQLVHKNHHQYGYAPQGIYGYNTLCAKFVILHGVVILNLCASRRFAAALPLNKN